MEEIVLPDTIDPETGRSIRTSRMTFVEIADDVSGSEILDPSKATKTETAETLLEALLADGEWHESDGVRKLMVAAGFTERTTQRAAKDIGVEIDRRGFPSVTWWRLPVAPVLARKLARLWIPLQVSRLESGGAPVAPTLVEGATDESARPLIGDDGYLPWLFERFERFERGSSPSTSGTRGSEHRCLVVARRKRNVNGAVVSDLRSHFAPELVEALEQLVDERVALAIADRRRPSDPVWLSLSEAADYKRVSLSTIARLRKQGRLRSLYVGRRVLVLRAGPGRCLVTNLVTKT